MALINLKDWSLVPGPLADPPPSSVHLQDIAAYPPRLVAEAFLAFPGMRVRHPAEPTWWNWIARWEQCERWIEVGFTLFEVECLGACDRAPVVMVNDAWQEVQRPEDVGQLLAELRTRGEDALTGCHHRVVK